MDTSQRFQLWYKEPIETLIAKDEHTGFAVLMLTLPILERYLRQKLTITQDNLPDSFHEELVKLFPQFQKKENAKRFWRVYRHGLLHQATLQGLDGIIAFVHNAVSIVECAPDGRTFGLSPNQFALAVLSIIENDLTTFENVSGSQPQLPSVQEHAAASGVFKP